MMTLDELRTALLDIARSLRLTGGTADVEKSGRWFHVTITAAEFRGMSQGERENAVWREFERRLDDETLLCITQCYLMTPEERANALTAAAP